MQPVGAARYRGKPFVGTALDPAHGPSVAEMTWLTSFQDTNEVFRSRHFEQGGGGRRDSGPFVGDTLLSLSGDAHFQRRRIVSMLFRPAMLRRYEAQVFAPAFAEALSRCERGAAGLLRGELQRLIRLGLAKVSATLVGIDGIAGGDAVDRYLHYMDKLAIGVNLEWLERDHATVMAELLVFKAKFAAEFFEPSWRRRAALVEEFRAGRLAREELPVDLITLIQLHTDHYDHWDSDLVLRETILFNGAPGSITLGVSHVVKELCDWLSGHPGDRALLVRDRDFIRRATLESIRLHPASPFLIRRALHDTVLDSGRAIAAGEYVVLDLLSASRDPDVFAPDPDRYDPHRVPRVKICPAGVAFGGGPHTCIGMAMSIGDSNTVDEEGPQGLMVHIVRELFRRGVQLDPDRPPRWNDINVRNEYAEFPVCFAAG